MWDTLVHDVVGIVENYHFSSLKDEVEPLMIVPCMYVRKVAIRINPTQMYQTLDAIEEIYSEVSPNYPISYEFLDDAMGRHYADEQNQRQIFKAFSGISIGLACLGIFGLVTFTVEKRRKEFGVRKVLGANATTIISLVSSEYIRVVFVSSILALPIAFYGLNMWLDHFAYRINLLDNWLIFAAGCLISLILAMITIVLRSLKAARSNPADSLRMEKFKIWNRLGTPFSIVSSDG